MWTRCTAHTAAPHGYDLFAVNYKLPYHIASVTQSIPWLTELSDWDSYAYRIMINEETAVRKGISDSDRIVVESTSGA